MSRRRGGIVRLQIDGEIYEVVGSWTYNFGRPVREPMTGSDGVHGYKEMPQIAFIEGSIRDSGGLDVAGLVARSGMTVSMELPNGKLFILYDAWFAGDGNVSTEEAEITARFEGIRAEEVTA